MMASVTGFYGLLLFTALSGLVAAGLWLRVAVGRSMAVAGRLDGTDKPLRANRRAFRSAIIVSILTGLLAVAAYEVGRSAGLL